VMNGFELRCFRILPRVGRKTADSRQAIFD
jgi:hypothetical protein